MSKKDQQRLLMSKKDQQRLSMSKKDHQRKLAGLRQQRGPQGTRFKMILKERQATLDVFEDINKQPRASQRQEPKKTSRGVRAV